MDRQMAKIARRNWPTPGLPTAEKFVWTPAQRIVLGKHYTTALTQKAGFQKMLGWECMFYHVELQVILSVYVDDLKMAGKKDNCSKA